MEDLGDIKIFRKNLMVISIITILVLIFSNNFKEVNIFWLIKLKNLESYKILILLLITNIYVFIRYKQYLFKYDLDINIRLRNMSMLILFIFQFFYNHTKLDKNNEKIEYSIIIFSKFLWVQLNM